MTDPYAPASPADFARFVGWAEDGEPVPYLLNEATRRYLHYIAVLLGEELDAELRTATKQADTPWTRGQSESSLSGLGLRDWLPADGRHTWETARRFVHSYSAVVYKLGNGPVHSHMLSNTMEEFAMRALIERAAVEIEVLRDMQEDPVFKATLGFEPDEVSDLDLLREAAYQDADHEMLFMAEFDGIDGDSEAVSDLGLDNLDPARWLTPFGGAPDKGHPLLWAQQ